MTAAPPRESAASHARRAVVVICDSLRRDLVTPADAPFLAGLAEPATWFDALHGGTATLAQLWLSEPDSTGHQSPLGSPAHRRAIAAADACVRQVAETVAALDPSGERILLLVGSDHGMETVSRIVDLNALLIEAGLKQAPGSRDVVIAPQGTSALLYFAEPDGENVARVARFLEAQAWVGKTYVGPALAGIGMPADGALRIAISFAP